MLASAYVVISVGLAGYSTVTDRPDLALVVWRSGPATEAAAIDRLVARDPNGAEEFARESLNRSLLSAPATRTLGFALLQQGADGSAIMDRAAALGWQDTPTQIWAIESALEADDPVTMVQRIDALLRREISTRDMLALIAHFLPARAFRDALRDRLAADPPWRGRLFDMLGVDAAVDYDSVADVFAEQAASGHAFALTDLARSVAMMARHEHYVPAYRLWSTRIREQGFGAPVRSDDANEHVPFAWTLANTGQIITKIAPDPSFGSGMILRVQGQTQQQGVVASRMLVLSPGRHRITMRTAGQSAGLHWALLCAPNRSFLASLAAGASGLIGGDFVVPADNCPAQFLTLQPVDSASGKLDVRYADLRIDPA